MLSLFNYNYKERMKKLGAILSLSDIDFKIEQLEIFIIEEESLLAANPQLNPKSQALNTARINLLSLQGNQSGNIPDIIF